MRITTWLAATVACVSLQTGAANARSTYPSRIPNGSVFSCSTCHLSAAGGGARNAFGAAFTGDNWSALVTIDCDGDGQTNGQELGDPCGTWQAGQTPGRTTDLSRPGDASSTSATPDQPACTSPDAGAASDASSSLDSASGTDAAASSDGGGADATSCTPVCLDRTRIFACNSAGQHLEQPCPTGTECQAGVCQAGAIGTGDDDDDSDPAAAGCGCQGAAGPALPAALGLALLPGLAWRRRRVPGTARAGRPAPWPVPDHRAQSSRAP